MRTEGVHVRIGTTGDSRLAVIERATGEPLQYVTDTASQEKLVERWDDALESDFAKARR